MNNEGTHTFILLSCLKKSVFIQEKIFDAIVFPLFASAEKIICQNHPVSS